MMIKTKKYLFFSLAIAVCLIVIKIFSPNKMMNGRHMQALLNKDISPGATIVEVDAWLQNRKITSSHFVIARGDEIPETVWRHSKAPKCDVSVVIIGFIRNTGISFVGEKNIRLMFFIDRSDKLINTSVEEVMTGP